MPCLANLPVTGLLDALDRAWVHLRSLRVVADLVLEAVHGNMSATLMRSIQRSEPLDREHVGYQVEEDLVEAWRRGLAAIAENADADLDVLS